MSKVFQFKQFSVDQSNCGMKVNTDAALLGSLAQNESVDRILEIGTGTGVIAMMLAQRYRNAQIDAVEIDSAAAETAEQNFRNSPFSAKIGLIHSSFEQHFSENSVKYDLIVSNPPYFINSLQSGDPSQRIARHTNKDFFHNLINGAKEHLTATGRMYLILPLDTADLVKNLTAGSELNILELINIHSFHESKPFRCILVIGLIRQTTAVRKVVIYEQQNVYTEQYRNLLKDYLTIF